MSDTLFRFPDKLFDKNAPEISKFRVAVAALSAGAGASYVSSVILRFGLMSGTTPEGLRTLAELGSPYFYFALGMEKRFAGRQFYDFESPQPYKLNMEMGYNWYLRAPDRTSETMSAGAVFRAVSSAPGNFIVFDCSGLLYSELLPQILAEMDKVYLVLDPLPSKLVEGHKNYEMFKEMFPESDLIVNKFNKGIHRGEFNRFIGTSKYFTIDALSYEKICRAEYNCNMI